MLLTNYICYDPESLTQEEALQIWEFKRETTHRALSAKFLGETNQIFGRDLARDAACKILDLKLDQLMRIEWGEDPEFDRIHSHAIPGGFWWE